MEKLYSLTEIANAIGQSKWTVYGNWKRWKAEGRLQGALKIGNRWRFPESEVEKLIKSFAVDNIIK